MYKKENKNNLNNLRKKAFAIGASVMLAIMNPSDISFATQRADFFEPMYFTSLEEGRIYLDNSIRRYPELKMGEYEIIKKNAYYIINLKNKKELEKKLTALEAKFKPYISEINKIEDPEEQAKYISDILNNLISFPGKGEDTKINDQVILIDTIKGQEIVTTSVNYNFVNTPNGEKIVITKLDPQQTVEAALNGNQGLCSAYADTFAYLHKESDSPDSCIVADVRRHGGSHAVVTITKPNGQREIIEPQTGERFDYDEAITNGIYELPYKNKIFNKYKIDSKNTKNIQSRNDLFD